MKKTIVIALIVAVALILTACNDYPYVKIVRGASGDNDTIIPIGHGYHLTKQIFTIDEHKDGYDIIIHVKAGLEPKEG